MENINLIVMKTSLMLRAFILEKKIVTTEKLEKNYIFQFLIKARFQHGKEDTY